VGRHPAISTISDILTETGIRRNRIDASVLSGVELEKRERISWMRAGARVGMKRFVGMAGLELSANHRHRRNVSTITKSSLPANSSRETSAEVGI
jgi:hypothetical protein